MSARLDVIAGTAWEGALVVLAFGLGTLPNLRGVGLLWQRFLRRRRPACQGCWPAP